MKFLGVYAENFQSYTRPTTIPFSAGKNLLKGGNDKGKTVLSNMIKVFAGIYKPFDYRGLINKNASKATVAIFTDERTIVTAHITPTSILYQLINWQGTIVFKQWDSWSVEIARYLGLISVEGENICLNLTSAKIAPFINTTDSLNTQIVDSISTIPQIDNKLKNLEEGLQVAKQTKKESEKMANYYSIMRRDSRKPVAQLTELINSLKTYRDYILILDDVLTVLISNYLSIKYQDILDILSSMKSIEIVLEILKDYSTVIELIPIIGKFSEVKKKKDTYTQLLSNTAVVDTIQSILQDSVLNRYIQDSIDLIYIEQMLSITKHKEVINTQKDLVTTHSNKVTDYKKQGLYVYNCKQCLSILKDYSDLQVMQRELRLCRGRYHTALVDSMQDIMNNYLLCIQYTQIIDKLNTINEAYTILKSYVDILNYKVELDKVCKEREKYDVCPLCHQELNRSHLGNCSKEVSSIDN